MDRDELFKLAVQLVGPTLPERFLSAPQTIPAVSLTICVAYNALLDAYSKIPERGAAPAD
jgi:hypothetical protein